MVLKVSHKELAELIEEHYKKKIALFIWGRFGIGKSEKMKDIAKKIAKEKGKEFVEWNSLREDKKKEVFKNCSKYLSCLIKIK